MMNLNLNELTIEELKDLIRTIEGKIAVKNYQEQCKAIGQIKTAITEYNEQFGGLFLRTGDGICYELHVNNMIFDNNCITLKNFEEEIIDDFEEEEEEWD